VRVSDTAQGAPRIAEKPQDAVASQARNHKIILWFRGWYRIPDASGPVPGVSPSTEAASQRRMKRMGHRSIRFPLASLRSVSDNLVGQASRQEVAYARDSMSTCCQLMTPWPATAGADDLTDGQRRREPMSGWYGIPDSYVKRRVSQCRSSSTSKTRRMRHELRGSNKGSSPFGPRAHATDDAGGSEGQLGAVPPRRP
jgi:hypothetical protein